jgi:CHAD domain-containing protein
VKARAVEGLKRGEPLRGNAAKIVRVRLDELRSFAEEALDPDAAQAQHDMRIAAKRLRYVLEIVGPCFNPEAKAARRAAKDLQGVIGEIHDCDVLLPRVEDVDSLATLLRARRELLFRRFHDLWQLEASKGTWAALERAL